MALIDDLIKESWLKSPEIIGSFRKIERRDFLPEDIKNLAELNEALSIGWGQTISQPLVVAFMLGQLQPKKGDKILDVGAGSGWTTALLAEIVGSQGKIIAMEIIPELKEFGERNVNKYNFIKKEIVEFICTDGSKGYSKEAPFDRILASAACQEIPPAWKEQVKVGGRIVVPIKNSIWLFIKKSKDEFEKFEYPGFVFVPLMEKTVTKEEVKKESKKVAIVIAFRDFRDEEYFIPKEILERAEIEIKTVSSQKGTAIGADGGEAEVDILLEDLNPADFEAIIFVGGRGCLKYLDNEDSYRIVKEAVSQNKILASICVSPVILAKTGVLQGKRATVWSSTFDKSTIKILKENGAIYQDELVVVDGKIITGNGPGASEKFGKTIIRGLTP